MVNRVEAGFKLLEMASDLDVPDRVLSAIQAEIRGVHEWIESVAQEDDGDWWYDEFGVVEELLGAASVVLQARITAVASVAWRIHESLGHKQYPKPKALREHLLTLGELSSAPSAVTKVRGIDVCANYFKHHEEWPPDWSKGGPHQQTAGYAIKLGMEKGAVAANLRRAFEKIGITDHNLAPLLNALRGWVPLVIHEARSWNGSITAPA